MTPEEEDEARRDPRREDRWEKTTKAGNVLTREVLRLWGQTGTPGRFYTYHLTYRDQRGREREVWFTTWEDWTRGAKLVKRGRA